ncbi:MAG: PKD domain-containing protein, partial [candidate division Zixibacteria bacterium]|nr:PKD domain-containing protein [candidate division Zixibacteria bacterium]
TAGGVAANCIASWDGSTWSPLGSDIDADFSGSPRSGTYPLTVNFTDLSTNNPTTWKWHFGDGSHTSTSQNPTYTYTSSGSYTVTLIATGPNGPDTATKIGYVTVTRPPTARWSFSFRGSPTGCYAWVWGTIDNVKQYPALFQRQAEAGYVYSGVIPEWANDLYMILKWIDPCENWTHTKVVALDYDGRWKFEYLAKYLRVHIGKERAELNLPTVGDSTGTIQTVYTVVNLTEWLAESRSLQDEYIIVDGECPDLPGYLIGTTPIVFDSLAGPDENPLLTTPLTGTLCRDGQTSAYVASTCCIDRGDVDGSGVLPIDIADLVYLVDFMFNAGPVPDCFDDGDVDGSGVEPIDIADLVYLVDYMFNSGPEPPPCP